jgi:Zn-dependent peptidase ImmA (M78 family)
MKYIEIIILNQVWKIYFVSVESSVLNESGNPLIGKCTSRTREIHISETLDAEMRRKTIIHELTHAVIMQLLLNKQEFTQEEVCDFTESYLDAIHFLANKENWNWNYVIEEVEE